jgi:hypothetical protein
VSPSELVAARQAQLWGVITGSFDNASSQSKAFSLRALAADWANQRTDFPQFDFSERLQNVRYEGFPGLAYLGFGIGALKEVSAEDPVVMEFVAALRQFRQSPKDRLKHFITDEVSVLGIADGMARLRAASLIDECACAWLVNAIEVEASSSQSSRRVLALAAEMLDTRRRLQPQLPTESVDLMALDLCLRRVWVSAFREVSLPARNLHETILRKLLVETPPSVGELDRATVWLVAISVLLEGSVSTLIPTISDTAKLLSATQTALKRWVWEQEARGKNAKPARWLIDNEYHVQSFLWAVLYPVFRDSLVSEEYLRGSALQQPRADFGIISLKLLIEVKHARQPSDFREFESQIAADLGLYFRDTSRFDRLIVYVYDDCDRHAPENYTLLRDALISRDKRIEDVVFVRRPSVIPSRADRRTK